MADENFFERDFGEYKAAVYNIPFINHIVLSINTNLDLQKVREELKKKEKLKDAKGTSKLERTVTIRGKKFNLNYYLIDQREKKNTEGPSIGKNEAYDKDRPMRIMATLDYSPLPDADNGKIKKLAEWMKAYFEDNVKPMLDRME